MASKSGSGSGGGSSSSATTQEWGENTDYYNTLTDREKEIMSNFPEDEFMEDIGSQFMRGNPVRNSNRPSEREMELNQEIRDLEERMAEIVDMGTRTTDPYELLKIAAEYGEIDERLEDLVGSY